MQRTLFLSCYLLFVDSYDKITKRKPEKKGDFMQDIGMQFHIRCQ